MKKERTNCRWWQFHKWEKWKDDGIVGLYTKDIWDFKFPDEPSRTLQRQRRYCKHCGKLQSKLIRL